MALKKSAAKTQPAHNTKKIEQVKRARVGEFYWVKCALIRNLADNARQYWVPIIGDYHMDKDFKVKFKHYHVDARFIAENDPYTTLRGEHHCSSVFTKDTPKLQPHHDYVHLVKYRRIKCRRVNTELFIPEYAIQGKLYSDFYKKYLGKSCAGRKCPHYGQTMHVISGKLVCPLHGLTADLKKEVIIPR